MSDLIIYRFQPDAMDEDVLRRLFVGRQDLLDTVRDEIEKAVKNRTPRYYLIVGPRGIGKSHFITLLYFEIRKLEGVVPVKLSEEEYSIYRVSDLFSRIFEEMEEKKISKSFETDDELIDTILEDLKSRNKMIVIFAENLNQILGEQMEENEVKKLRSIFQEEDIFIVVATSPLIFAAASQGSEPFYNFFDIKHLRELTEEEVKEMIRIIHELEGNTRDLELYYGKIDSIIKLTGGSPRIVILLYDLMSKGEILEVEKAFFKILDEYTPYYQDVVKTLTGQRRRIFDVLISLEPATPKEIAEAARLNNNVVVTQLRRLEKDGYLISHRIGKNVKYEVRERLLRLWREQRQPLGRKRITILIEFLRLWYTPEEREKEFDEVIRNFDSDIEIVRRIEYLFCSLPEESKMKFVPELTREFYERGMPGLLEELVETEGERLKRAVLSEKFAVLFKHQKYDDILEETEKMIQEKEDYVAWITRGTALIALQRYEEALKAFDRALEINPDEYGAWIIRGRTLGSLQRYEEALKAFDRGLKINPDKYGAWYYRGRALVGLKRYEEALKAFDRALEINPEDQDTLINKGFVLADLQRYEEALKAFDRALEINPDEYLAWIIRGFALGSLQRYEEALKAFDRALEINPKNDGTLFTKATTHLEISTHEFAQKNYGNAIHHLNSAIDSFLKIWDTWETQIKEEVLDFFKNLTGLRQIEAVDISLKTIVTRQSELTPFLKPISVAVDIVKTKDLKKYYDIQVEERDIVQDIVKRLTGSEELLPE